MTSLSYTFPTGTVLGGPDNPMQIDAVCPACCRQLPIEYHDVQRRWQAASTIGSDCAVLDMQCPGCAASLRLVIEADEWRMTLWAFHLVGLHARAGDGSTRGDQGQPLETFHANRHATGWWWWSPGFASGSLECHVGLLRFQFAHVPVLGRLLRLPTFEHRAPRVVLSSPTMPIPNHFTIVTFEQGVVSVSIPGNRDLLRSTLRDCGFAAVEAPSRRSWVRNHRELWQQYGEGR